MSAPVALSNSYVFKTATTDAPCFVCSKFCTGVLRSDTGDWFYVCQSHLSDPGFCKVVAPPSAQPAPRPASPAPANLNPPGWIAAIGQTLGITGSDDPPSTASNKKEGSPNAEAAAAKPQQSLYPAVPTTAPAAAAPPAPTKYVLTPNIFCKFPPMES
ncbi:hypothetical protein BDZ88DRAFT_452361 [Geranomyces variabilis]|nr:hypothetical protein BDZ88DRAFT_452361 [Geranomyces variabilis]KAJ3140489.1 hypothetical protein HDU90_007787 [Geranomyces variabilis]